MQNLLVGAAGRLIGLTVTAAMRGTSVDVPSVALALTSGAPEVVHPEVLVTIQDYLKSAHDLGMKGSENPVATMVGAIVASLSTRFDSPEERDRWIQDNLVTTFNMKELAETLLYLDPADANFGKVVSASEVAVGTLPPLVRSTVTVVRKLFAYADNPTPPQPTFVREEFIESE